MLLWQRQINSVQLTRSHIWKRVKCIWRAWRPLFDTARWFYHLVRRMSVWKEMFQPIAYPETRNSARYDSLWLREWRKPCAKRFQRNNAFILPVPRSRERREYLLHRATVLIHSRSHTFPNRSGKPNCDWRWWFGSATLAFSCPSFNWSLKSLWEWWNMWRECMQWSRYLLQRDMLLQEIFLWWWLWNWHCPPRSLHKDHSYLLLCISNPRPNYGSFPCFHL